MQSVASYSGRRRKLPSDVKPPSVESRVKMRVPLLEVSSGGTAGSVGSRAGNETGSRRSAVARADR
jgi:hypothetical protein